MKKLITIFGASEVTPGSNRWAMAEELGKLLGEANFALVTGGYDGTMEAASRGASAAGATVIGVTAEVYSARGRKANAFVGKEVSVKSSTDRLMELVDLADGYCALNNSPGTLLEVMTAWEFIRKNFTQKKPFVLLGDDWAPLRTYFENHASFRSYRDIFVFTNSPQDAVAYFVRELGAERKLPDLNILP